MESEFIIAPGISSFVEGPSVRSHKLTGPAPPRAAGDRLALVVEDEWLVRLELVYALEAAGWAVIETNSAEEALELLCRGERFDLVVTDIRLGGAMTGWDVAEAFRRADSAVGIVYASGNSVLAHRQVVGSVFMSKPVLIGDLIAVCEQIWNAGVKDPHR